MACERWTMGLTLFFVFRGPSTRRASKFKRPAGRTNRVGGGLTLAVLPHHRTYGSVPGDS
ncbi:MAG: hypothetical protein J5861_04605 [Desulfovibrio sp.]|nr:hypothetical protein [Desulfovibrio sp.]